MSVIVYLIAGSIRFWLINIDNWPTIANRVEITTPHNSWKRLIEGIYLYDHNIDPYEGDSFHESPVILVTFYYLIKTIPNLLPLIFTLLDLLTAKLLFILAKSSMQTLKRSEEKNKTVIEESKTLLLSDKQVKEAAEYVQFVYLLNPYSVLNCVGMTTTVLQNVLLATALCAATRQHRVLSCAALALATHQALYPVLLIVPISLILAQNVTGCTKCSHIRTGIMFMVFWGLLIYISALIMNGSYQYVNNTYGSILSVSELKPNVGLFWYFFTEMFEHFRLLFTCTFQINALVLYIVPLTLKFRHEPMLLTTVLLSLSAIFRSYPCIGDVGFYFAFLPMWIHLESFMQQKLVVAGTFMVASALGPTVWHLWIYSGSANANFFFGVTLAFATAQIFLITDLVFAYDKREYTLGNGTSREKDGKTAKLVLQ